MDVTLSETDLGVGRACKAFFGVIVRKQTYRNLVYLLLTLPRGLFYLTILSMGFVSGIGLIVVLFATLAAIGSLTRIERWVTRQLLRIDIPVANRVEQTNNTETTTLTDRFMGLLTAPETPRSLLYLLVVSATGIVWVPIVLTLLLIGMLYLSFVAVPLGLATGGSITLPSVAIGADVWIAQAGAIYGSFIDLSITPNIAEVETLSEALLYSPIGMLFVIIALHVSNGVAMGLRILAEVLFQREGTT